MEPAYKWIVDAKVCGTCAHYRQHYTLQSCGVFRPLWYGHCHVPRWGKHPRPDETCPTGRTRSGTLSRPSRPDSIRGRLPGGGAAPRRRGKVHFFFCGKRNGP